MQHIFLNLLNNTLIMADKKLVGKVSHYYANIGVAVVDLTDSLSVGDNISIEGSTTNIQQAVDSMQVEHKAVKDAKKGESIGMKVSDKVRNGDNVYKVVE